MILSRGSSSGVSGVPSDRRAWCDTLLSVLAMPPAEREARRSDPRWRARRREVVGFGFDCEGRECTDMAQAVRAMGFCPDLRTERPDRPDRPGRRLVVFMDVLDSPVPGGEEGGRKALAEVAEAMGARWDGTIMGGKIEI